MKFDFTSYAIEQKKNAKRQEHISNLHKKAKAIENTPRMARLVILEIEEKLKGAINQNPNSTQYSISVQTLLESNVSYNYITRLVTEYFSGFAVTHHYSGSNHLTFYVSFDAPEVDMKDELEKLESNIEIPKEMTIEEFRPFLENFEEK